ncbi:MAG: Ig-like domain-containing protein [Psychromonas sp.]|nr:Ig-like domain-containing protein [Psychromonas sp.]
MPFLKSNLIFFLALFLMGSCFSEGSYAIAKRTNNGTQSLVISPFKTTINKETSVAYVATLIKADGTKQNVTDQVSWSSNNANLISIDEKGIAKSIAGKGSVVIFAQLNASKAQATLTITDKQLLNLVVTPSHSILRVGLTKQFNATATFADNSQQNISRDVTWSASDSNASVDDLGLMTANSVSQGTTINASYLQQNGTATSVISASEIKEINITPSIVSLNLGVVEQLSATVILADDTAIDVVHNVKWISSDPTIADVNSDGLVTADSVGHDKVNVSLSYAGESISTDVDVTVLPAKLISIDISPKNVNVPQGAYAQYSAVGLNSDGSIFDLTRQVVWQSSDPQIAIFKSNGFAIAEKAGNTKITAKFSGITGQTDATVNSATLQGIDVEPTQKTLPTGLKFQYQAFGRYSNGTVLELTDIVSWMFDKNTDLASFDPLRKGLLTADKEGSAMPTATLGTDTASANLNILKPRKIKYISITPINSKAIMDTFLKFTATALYDFGNGKLQDFDVTNETSWSTNMHNDLSFDKNGLSLAVHQSIPGSPVGINARFGGHTYNAMVDVVNQLVDSIQVTPATKVIAMGRSQQYTAIAFYKDGSYVDITTQANWNSSDNSVISIKSLGNKSGLAQSHDQGNEQISAMFSGVSSNKASINVFPAASSGL